MSAAPRSAWLVDDAGDRLALIGEWFGDNGYAGTAADTYAWHADYAAWSRAVDAEAAARRAAINEGEG